MNSQYHLMATAEVWKSLTDTKSRLYLASFEPFYYVTITAALLFLLASVILLVQLGVKAKAFLTWVVIYLIAEFAYSTTLTWLFFKLERELREKNVPDFTIAANQIQYLPYLCVIGILFTFIWFRYFTSSNSARLVFE